MSDQNFLDDDVEGGRESSLVSAKRMKTVVVDTCVNDQVLCLTVSIILLYSVHHNIMWFSIH